MNAQVQSVNLDGKSFKVKDGKWVTASVEGEEYIVNTRSMTVKLRNQHQSVALQALANAHGFEIERTNKLGYADIKLSAITKFYEFHPVLKNSGLFESVEVNSYGELYSNDPYFSQQYYLYNSSGYPFIDCADPLWQAVNGSENPVTIAVIDVGVKNANDLSGLVSGYNFITGTSDPNPQNTTEDWHGTMVAGIVAAKTQNNLLIAGIAGGYDTDGGSLIQSLIIARYETGNGWWDPPGTRLYSQYIDDAIIYAADNGAKIINISLGMSQSSAIDAAIEYAYKSKGVLLVAAAGNYNQKPMGYPARHSLVFAVGGILKNWQPHAVYNIYGPPDLVAPSQEIVGLSTTGNGIRTEWGTSFASPMVCGTAALLWNYDTELIHLDLKKLILNNAESLNPSSSFGNGLLKTYDAVGDLDMQLYLGARPDNVSVTIQSNSPVLTWNTVQEVESVSKYNIYRSYSATGRFDFQKIGSVTHNGNNSTHSYTDNSVTAISGNGGPQYYYYRINIEESSGKEGILSSEVSVSADPEMQKSFQAGNNEYTFSLDNNYPNPFNPVTKIKYSLEYDTEVSLTAYNMLGEKIANLINGFQQAGKHEITFDAGNIPSGVYFYRIEAGNFSASRKMIFSK